MIILKCRQCGKQYKEKPYRKDKSLYCSQECYGLSERGLIPKSAWKKGQHISPKTEFKRGRKHKNFGKSSGALGKHWKLSKETKDRMSNAQRGIPHINSNGKKHWNWKKDRTLIKRQNRHDNPLYKEWRKKVLKRDNYTCQICHAKDKKLHADHVKRYCLYPKLRFHIDNGRTLCVDCHKKTDTWGNVPKLQR